MAQSTTYTLTYDKTYGLICTTAAGSGAQAAAAGAAHTVSIDELLKGFPSSMLPAGKNEEQLEYSQQKINYLDCIKDGTNVHTLKGLNIFPNAAPAYPIFNNDLHTIENGIISAHASQIETQYWHKTRPNGSQAELNKPKIYPNVLWEAGLGPKWFAAKDSNGTPSTYIKTFGSYIDPLEKSNADQTWPPIGNRVVIDSKAMQAMGFPNSSLEATTMAGDKFEFTLTIGSGQGCNPCRITHATQGFQNYFAGNKTKNKLTKKKGAGPPSNEKVKMIMVKEWGDKMQCLIYLLLHFAGNKGMQMPPKMTAGTGKSVMSSCDKVVYILCLLLKVDFIYSGYDDGPNAPTYKHYSISHFKPVNDPVQYMKEVVSDAETIIEGNNNSFVQLLNSITPSTKLGREAERIQFASQETRDAFIGGCVEDVNDYTQTAKTALQALIGQLDAMKSMSPEEIGKLNPAELQQQKLTLSIIEDTIESVKKANTVEAFFKVKKGTKMLSILAGKVGYIQGGPKSNKPKLLARLESLGLNPEASGAKQGAENEVLKMVPFANIIIGKQKGGSAPLRSTKKGADGKELPLVITKPYSDPMQGGRKKNQRGGESKSDYLDFTPEQYNNMIDGMALTEEQAAMLIGYLPEPFIPATWNKYLVKQKIEVTPTEATVAEDNMRAVEGTAVEGTEAEPNLFKEGSFFDKNGEEGELYTEIDLEQNLIMGILAYCWMNGVPVYVKGGDGTPVLQNRVKDLSFFGTIYSKCIYEGINMATAFTAANRKKGINMITPPAAAVPVVPAAAVPVVPAASGLFPDFDDSLLQIDPATGSVRPEFFNQLFFQAIDSFFSGDDIDIPDAQSGYVPTEGVSVEQANDFINTYFSNRDEWRKTYRPEAAAALVPPSPVAGYAPSSVDMTTQGPSDRPSQIHLLREEVHQQVNMDEEEVEDPQILQPVDSAPIQPDPVDSVAFGASSPPPAAAAEDAEMTSAAPAAFGASSPPPPSAFTPSASAFSPSASAFSPSASAFGPSASASAFGPSPPTFGAQSVPPAEAEDEEMGDAAAAPTMVVDTPPRKVGQKGRREPEDNKENQKINVSPETLKLSNTDHALLNPEKQGRKRFAVRRQLFDPHDPNQGPNIALITSHGGRKKTRKHKRKKNKTRRKKKKINKKKQTKSNKNKKRHNKTKHNKKRKSKK